MKKITIVLVSMIFGLSQAQNTVWKAKDLQDIPGDPQIEASDAFYFQLDVQALQNILWQAPLKTTAHQTSSVEISLPLSDGSSDVFKVFEAPIMEEGLALKFPSIKTFILQSTTNPLRYGRADLTPKGFHFMLFSDGGTQFIDPYSSLSNSYYIAYDKSKFTTDKPLPDCLSVDDDEYLLDDASLEETAVSLDDFKSAKSSNGATLRIYRLAVSATAEYTQFHGGTVVDGLAAVVTSVNRVNGVYEREFTARLVLVADNDQIIYTNENTDPFTNPNNPGQLLTQNRNSINAEIGLNNYDVGHVVGTGGSGLASFGVVCRNNKAQGTTGINNPIGDPFDIDYLAHELGHQFAGSHTFNSNAGSCSGGNLSPASAYEPGSATTIMGYAGICAPHNVQNNSDDYFHTRTFDQVVSYINDAQGDNCPVKETTGNNIPTIQVLSPINQTIPKSTPFQLQALANDPDGDAITYCWEQFDLGPTGDPNNPVGNAPLFRSFQPTPSPIRTFPQMDDIVNNTQTLGEILPDYGRGLFFRITVRDNVPGMGAVNNDEYAVTVTNNAGPFLVSNPNTNITWTAGNSYNVEWDVADTDQSPVNCGSVNILLSTDGGYTYPVSLASNVPNNGTASIVAPFALTSQARVRVEAADNIFFDISNQNFQIVSNCGVVDPSINIVEQVPNATWCINTLGELSFTANSPDLVITSYQWFFNGLAIPGATGPSLSINNVQQANEGEYYCTLSNGCNTVSTNSATVFVTSNLIVPVITQVGNQLQSSVPTNIQWFLGGQFLPGETNEFITITSSGEYTVRSIAGSCSATSAPFMATSVKDLNEVASIQITPNPSTGNFRIQTGNFKEELELSVLNVLGQTAIPDFSFQNETILDLTSFTNGLYIVLLRSKNYQASYKLIKK